MAMKQSLTLKILWRWRSLNKWDIYWYCSRIFCYIWRFAFGKKLPKLFFGERLLAQQTFEFIGQ